MNVHAPSANAHITSLKAGRTAGARRSLVLVGLLALLATACEPVVVPLEQVGPPTTGDDVVAVSDDSDSATPPAPTDADETAAPSSDSAEQADPADPADPATSSDTTAPPGPPVPGPPTITSPSSVPGDTQVLPSDTTPPPPTPDPAVTPGTDPPPAPNVINSRGVAGLPAWSSPSTWPGGRVPGTGEKVTIPAGMKVRLDRNVTVAGLDVDGELYFDPASSVRLDSTRNVVVTGRLVMTPDSAQDEHHLRFLGVNEARFKGGGMDVIESDIGLWVMDQGQLVTQGAVKRGWSRATGGIAKGATQVTVTDASGWRVGDKIAIAPTALPAYGTGAQQKRTFDGFHEATITAVSGNRVTFSPATTDIHPEVNNKWTAEVMNLSRNVQITGEDYDHKSHIFIRAQRPQFIRHTELRFLSPGKVSDGGFEVSGQVLGRYGLHLHHGMNAMRGTIVEGVSLHEFGNNGFVPHLTHGVTFRDTVAYDGGNSPYWWDLGDDSHDILWDYTIAGRTRGNDSVYFLGSGHNVEVRNSVAVGAIAKTNAGGFEWENGTDGSWEFTNNVAHNITGNGVRIWQNTNSDHVLQHFDVYHVSQYGVTVGAYTNNYHFRDFEIYGTGYTSFEIMATPRQGSKANAEPPSVVLERGVIDGGNTSEDTSIGIRHSAVPGTHPIQIRDVTIRGRAAQRAPAIEMTKGARDKKVDLINVTIEPGPTPDFYLDNGTASKDGDGQSWIRVQNGSEAYRLRPQDQNYDSGATLVSEWNAWKKNIAPFRPATVGTGSGLLGEYYDDLAMTKMVYTGLDPYIEVAAENDPVYHLLDRNATAVRWRGQVQPQESGSYTFRVESDRARLWVNGQKIIDNWSGGGSSSGSISLSQGRRYDIVLEVGDDHKASDRLLRFTAHLYWKQPSYPIEQWVAQSQLYLPDGYSSLPFTANDPQVAPNPRLG